MNQNPNVKTEMVKLSAIRLDVAAQVREKLDEGTVAEYAEAMEAGATFPPVTLFRDPEGGTNWLADGRHRVEAAKRARFLALAATVHPGTQSDAELHAMGANDDHGLRRSPEDKRLSVRLALKDPERAKLSDREIARICKVSQPFVGKMRGRKGDNVIAPADYPASPFKASCVPDPGTSLVGYVDEGPFKGWLADIVPAAGFEDGDAFWIVVFRLNDNDENDSGDCQFMKRPFHAWAIPHCLQSMGFPADQAEWSSCPLEDGPDSEDDEGPQLASKFTRRWSWPHGALRSKREYRAEVEWWAFPVDSDEYRQGRARAAAEGARLLAKAEGLAAEVTLELGGNLEPARG